MFMIAEFFHAKMANLEANESRSLWS